MYFFHLKFRKLGEFSEDYRQTVAFYYGLGTGDSVTIGNATGLMVVDASDVKYFFESNGEDRFACSTEEQIQLRGDNTTDVNWEYKYQTNYNEINTSKNRCRDSEVDSPDRRGSIEILRRNGDNGIQISTTYVIWDMDNSSIF